eukprot:3228599-Rhodomonas_salina.1
MTGERVQESAPPRKNECVGVWVDGCVGGRGGVMGSLLGFEALQRMRSTETSSSRNYPEPLHCCCSASESRMASASSASSTSSLPPAVAGKEARPE